MNGSELLRVAASLAVPPRCGICGGACSPSEPACERCLAALRAAAPVRRALPGFEAVVGAARYGGVARELVAGLKFGARPGLASLAAAAMARALGPNHPDDAACVPVPAAPSRLRRRGFDPADAIVAPLARDLGTPLVRCLVRPSSRRQVGRSRSDRLACPPRVSSIEAAPTRAILVDDVLTTGATLAACARALRDAGSRDVTALVFAVASSTRARSWSG